MIFDALIKAVALKEGVTVTHARSMIRTTFAVIKEEVLAGSGRVPAPQFGVFLRRTSKAGLRPVMGVMKAVPATKRVVFRVSTGATGAKSSE